MAEYKLDEIIEKLELLIEQKKFGVIKNEINELLAPDVAEILEELNETNRLIVFGILKKDNASE
ncbi:MAG: magnesium transporter, partial [Candidatus Cloacimonetes bacterium]|nr:magnesium transporter [Candidatus Cloacimonadota bacterium]